MINDKEFSKRYRTMINNTKVGNSTLFHLMKSKQGDKKKNFIDNIKITSYHQKIAREQIVKNRILTQKEKDDIWNKS